jgi:hypothetical protein
MSLQVMALLLLYGGALAFSLHSLPHLDGEMLKGLSEAVTDGSARLSHVRLTSISAKATPLSPETVTSAWLSSLGQSVLAHLRSKVLPRIQVLSVAGAAQLAGISCILYTSKVKFLLNVNNPQVPLEYRSGIKRGV